MVKESPGKATVIPDGKVVLRLEYETHGETHERL